MTSKKVNGIIIFLIVLVVGLFLYKNFEHSFLDTTEEYSVLEYFDSLELIGVADTGDNPWGKNLSLIGGRDGNNAVLFTPNTGIYINNVTGEDVGISFDYYIYDEMINISDGMNILIKIFDSNDKVVKEDKINVKSNRNINRYNKSFKLDKDRKYSIQIMCDNGIEDDDEGDWLIVENMYLNVSGWSQKRDNPFPEYVKAVHYFGEEWPINFWNSEMDGIEEDFDQIKGDGFNTIILVIPWREFQPNINPIQYNEYALTRLNDIMKLAEAKDIYVMVRIGYTWDYYNDKLESSEVRFYDVVKNKDTRGAWLEYVETLYDVLKGYNSFIGGFITWEDFWNNTYLMDNLDDINERILWAKDMGFQKFVEDHYVTIKEFNQKYSCDFNNYLEIYIPYRNNLFAEEYYIFFDEFMINLLEESQQYFPNLSMEVRTDWDTYYDVDNTAFTHQHYSTFPCANSNYTSVMYGIPQGCDNIGERLSYDEALEKTEYILNSISQYNMSKPIFVDQFLFYDNTPGYEMNAQIKREEIGDYLENVAYVLEEYTCGYAIWTYKDYASNIVYNSQFAIGKEGWFGERYNIIDNYDGGNSVEILAGGELSQTIPESRNHFLKEKLMLEFDIIESNKGSQVEIKMGESKKSIQAKAGHYAVEFMYNGSYDLTFMVSDRIIIDNIKLYSHVQEGYLYPKGQEGISYMDSLKIMNAKLEMSQ